MSLYNENARTVINAFLWEELKEADILSEEQYRLDDFTSEVIPIIPAQQLPEFNNLIGDKPYIIYDYEVEGYGDSWWICEEILTYTIVGNKTSTVVEIMELMVDLFRRVDDSGQDVQRFNPKTDKIKFYSVSLSSASSPVPFETEGGRVAGSVEISYKYSRILDSNGRFA